MPRFVSIVMVFTFVLLPLTGCGSSSLLEAKTPAPEAIKIVEDNMAKILKESNDELAYARKGNNHSNEYEKKLTKKVHGKENNFRMLKNLLVFLKSGSLLTFT